MINIRKVLRQNEKREIHLNFSRSNRFISCIISGIFKAISILILGIVASSNIAGVFSIFSIVSAIGVAIVILILGINVSASDNIMDTLKLILLYFCSGILYALCFIVTLILIQSNKFSFIKWLSSVSFFNAIINFACYFGCLITLELKLR